LHVAELPQGELLALDIGKHMQRNDGAPLEAEGYTEDRILMVVHVPKGLDPVRDTLHKVGSTNNIFVPVSTGGCDKASRAMAYNGIVVEDNLKRYRIGGASSRYCHPLEPVETPATRS
jgi:hypothetical protein